jgi:fructose-1,6-bisphosphatase/inositol monophosphatase family enzyme
MDFDQVARVIRETAAAEIMPRFRALGAEDIREKKPGDFVTIADLEAERRLAAELIAALPESLALGEESVAADPARLQLLDGEKPVWVIDPIDGTGNFARGDPRFTVIVALVARGTVEAGWIYDPVGERMIWARRGGGAWCDEARLRLAPAPRPDGLAGSAYGRTFSGERAARVLGAIGGITVRNRGCSGLEYIELARGEVDFSLHSRSLPWDHAAGMMIVAEAGGVARFLDGSAYDPRIADKKPLAATTEEAWQRIASIVTAPAPSEV